MPALDKFVGRYVRIELPDDVGIDGYLIASDSQFVVIEEVQYNEEKAIETKTDMVLAISVEDISQIDIFPDSKK